jgi:hypothetical protein
VPRGDHIPLGLNLKLYEKSGHGRRLASLPGVNIGLLLPLGGLGSVSRVYE